MLIIEVQEKCCVPPITKSVVKQRPIFLLPSTWDAYYMHDRHVFGEGLDAKIRQRMVEHNHNELPTNRQLSH
jgi:hypothetical protein